jgi:hypothetical protein
MPGSQEALEMEPDFTVEMVAIPTNQYRNLPKVFEDGKYTRVVRFQTLSGAHCVADTNNVVTGDLKISPQSFDSIDKDDDPNFMDVTITGTDGSWSFQCCNHPEMQGSITVKPPA